MFMDMSGKELEKDGDHNILNNNNLSVFPMRYEALVQHSDENALEQLITSFINWKHDEKLEPQ